MTTKTETPKAKKEPTEAQRKARNAKRAAARKRKIVAPKPNPWLVGATVRVLASGGPFDHNKQGTIEKVVGPDIPVLGPDDLPPAYRISDAHSVTVRLQTGEVITFLSDQLELV